MAFLSITCPVNWSRFPSLQRCYDDEKYVVSVSTVDCPTVLECIRFQGRERIINIPQEIGNKYHEFGLFLLDDPNGARVRNMEHDYRKIEQINTEILREWATGWGKKPVSWKTLTEVLRDIELCTLASEIEAVKLI